MKCESSDVDTLMIYNLSPATKTEFKNIRLCSNICDDYKLDLPEDHRILRMRDDFGKPVFDPARPLSIFNSAVRSMLNYSINLVSFVCIVSLSAV